MNTCKSGKVCYESKQEATKILGLHAKYKTKALGVYKCTDCDRWHLGRGFFKKLKR